MSDRFDVTTVIDRPIEDVFAFLADGTNDPKFSPRVQEIVKRTDGPVGVGTVFASTVKDAGMKSTREFEITEFAPPTKIRWTERTTNAIMVPDGGYDLSQAGDGKTQVTLFNTFATRGFGKLIKGVALRAARKDAGPFGDRIKAAVEASSSPSI